MKLAKENKINLNFNEVVGSKHVIIACDVLPTLKHGVNTNQAYKLIDNDGIRIGPINGKFLKRSMLENLGLLLGKSLNYPL